MDTVNSIGIEQKLGYQFKSKELLAEALRHSSYVNEQPASDLRDNERLEFLGDAVLNLIVGHILMERYPQMKEGDLSRTRANLVNETQLATMARSIGLGSYLQLGKGEVQTHGMEKNSILAGAYEALIAALYLDSGYKATFNIIENNFLPILDQVQSASDSYDYKSRLQEWVQEKHGAIPNYKGAAGHRFSQAAQHPVHQKHGAIPNYKIVNEEGPDHDKTFWVSVMVFGIEAQGTGKNKKTAEQDAARKALEILEKESQ